LNDNSSELLNDGKPTTKSRNAKPQRNTSQARQRYVRRNFELLYHARSGNAACAMTGQIA
jgi:hypothetical protein